MAEDSYDALVERVDEALSVMERDENRGMDLLIDVLQADPEHFYALSVLSQVLLGQGQYEPAAQAAQRLIDGYPDEDMGYFRMAMVLLEQQNYAEAERYAEEAVSKDPYDADNYALLGDARERAHGLAAAEEPLAKAVELDPQSPGHRIGLGVLRVQLGRPLDGLPDLRAAVDLGADEGQLRLMLDAMASLGLPDPLRGLYRTVSYLLAQPDLSEPGAAGTDHELLEQQADVARRLAVPLGQDEPTTRAAWRLSRELAEAVLAVEPDNRTAQEALKDLALSEGRSFALYSDTRRSEAYVAALRDLADQLRDAYDAVEKDQTPETMRNLFKVAGDMLRVIEQAEDWDSPLSQKLIKDLTESISQVRAQWRPGPDEAQAAAEAFAEAGLVTEFADFYRWLSDEASGPDGKTE